MFGSMVMIFLMFNYAKKCIQLWYPFLMRKFFWIKEESYAHSGNCSSEKFIIFNFWFLFVTKNGILRFSSFGVTKWQWIKNSKWNHPKLGDCGFKKQIGYGFWPLFVTKNCILRFSIFDLIKKQRIKNSKWKHLQYTCLRS